ncbi:MAG TPA: hypothetical protein VM121_00040 [Acidimicrobiales bacterium]|nr:hypothetical protein [Acidimicrobiales bacterium]
MTTEQPARAGKLRLPFRLLSLMAVFALVATVPAIMPVAAGAAPKIPVPVVAPPAAGQIYASQSGGVGVVSLVNGGGPRNSLANVNTFSDTYAPNSNGLVTFDRSTHKINVLVDSVITVFIAPSWSNPGAGTGGKIQFGLYSNQPQSDRFYWTFNYPLASHPTGPTDGSPPIFPPFIFKAGDVVEITTQLFGGGTASIDVDWMDVGVTAVAVKV